MKHGNYILYQNKNTVIPIERNFYKDNREQFLLLFQMDEFSATQEVMLVCQGLVYFGVSVEGEFSLSSYSSS